MGFVATEYETDEDDELASEGDGAQDDDAEEEDDDDEDGGDPDAAGGDSQDSDEDSEANISTANLTARQRSRNTGGNEEFLSLPMCASTFPVSCPTWRFPGKSNSS